MVNACVCVCVCVCVEGDEIRVSTRENNCSIPLLCNVVVICSYVMLRMPLVINCEITAK